MKKHLFWFLIRLTFKILCSFKEHWKDKDDCKLICIYNALTKSIETEALTCLNWNEEGYSWSIYKIKLRYLQYCLDKLVPVCGWWNSWNYSWHLVNKTQDYPNPALFTLIRSMCNLYHQFKFHYKVFLSLSMQFKS